VGFRDEICSIGPEWGTLLWARLNRYPVGVQFAASQADSDINQVMRDRLNMDEAERAAVLATIQNRFIGGDAFVTIRPARWADE
jgi:hypothetical protein